VSTDAAPATPGRQVPAYTVTDFASKRHRHCVAVFVINENGRLLAQLAKMLAVGAPLDVVIADGGSTDGSTTKENLAPRGVRTLLVKTGPGKLSAQMRMAFDWAMRQGYEGVVTIDGNDKDGPEALTSFVAALDRGVDHVQGSRYVPGGVAINTPKSRALGIKLLHAPLISLAARFRYTDTTNGFRAYSRRFLLDSRVDPFRDVFARYELHYYLAIRAARLGFRVEEVPVTRAYPDKGPIPTKISPWKGNWLVLKTLFNACLGRFDPPRAK
jgi:glycosyltransferase involved in cell wall biosynthesis